MDDAGLDALLDAIRQQHGCTATWVESVPVTEIWQGGEILWHGEVQVFDVDHPKAKRAYAWSCVTDEGTRRFVAVLGIGPVIDASTAMRASIVAPKHRSDA